MFRAAMTAVVACALLSGCGSTTIGGTPDQNAVRFYLKDNLPSGKFEEIKWWSVKSFKGGKRSIRLKYRTQNPLGGMTIFDDAFYVKNGKVYEWHQGDGQIFHGN